MEPDAVRQRAADLDRAWDALLDDPTTTPPPHLDDVRARVLRALSTPIASPDLAAAQERVWQRLLHLPVHQKGTDMSMPTPLTLSPNGHATLPTAPPRKRTQVSTWGTWPQVAAVLLVLALAGGFLLPRSWWQPAAPDPTQVLPAVTTQEATPAATPSPEAAVALPAWAQAWLQAYIDEDPRAFADLYTNDATYEEAIVGGFSVHDRFSIVEIAAGIMARQKDLRITATGFNAGDDWAVLEYTWSYTDAFSGRPVTDVRMVTVFDLNADGLITHSTDYYDSLAIETQLGMTLVEAATPAP